MTPFVRGFADELTKVAFGSHAARQLNRAQIALAQGILGSDPRVPVPFAESQLDDAVSKLRLQQRLIEQNRMAMGMNPEPDEKQAMLGYVTPRTVRRVVQNTGYDDRDPGFQAIARQLTGSGNINQMTQPQLRTLMALMTGRAG